METVFFTILVVCCLLYVVATFSLLKKLKSKHQIEVQNLKQLINELLKIQDKQNGKIVISQKSEIKLQTSRLMIDKNIQDLQNELIRKLADNKLID